jgi:hypothetical protein
MEPSGAAASYAQRGEWHHACVSVHTEGRPGVVAAWCTAGVLGAIQWLAILAVARAVWAQYRHHLPTSVSADDRRPQARRLRWAGEAAEQGVEADEAEHNGASQLNSSVRRLLEG